VTTQAKPTELTRAATTNLPPRQPLLALSGVVFVPFFVVGWLTSSGSTPRYSAGDQKWTDWAHDNQYKGRISALALLLAAFIFLHFIATIRSVLEDTESSLRGSVQLARVAFAGAVTGIAGLTMAFVTIANASSEGANANPDVSRAVTTAAGGPFFIGAVGFAAFLIAVGVLTLQSGAFARWTGIVALIGALSFLITLLTIPQGTGEGSVFGYAFFPANLSLVIWTIATSIAR
jgi:succinate dehydrogenase/fumarate reductase cytochrome b subunit